MEAPQATEIALEEPAWLSAMFGAPKEAPPAAAAAAAPTSFFGGASTAPTFFGPIAQSPPELQPKQVYPGGDASGSGPGLGKADGMGAGVKMGQTFSSGLFAPPPGLNSGKNLADWNKTRIQPGQEVPLVIGQRLGAAGGDGELSYGGDPGTPGRGSFGGGSGNVYGEGNVPSSYGFGNTIQVGDSRYLQSADPKALQALAYGQAYTPMQSSQDRVAQILADQAALKAAKPPEEILGARNDYWGGGDAGWSGGY